MPLKLNDFWGVVDQELGIQTKIVGLVPFGPDVDLIIYAYFLPKITSELSL